MSYDLFALPQNLAADADAALAVMRNPDTEAAVTAANPVADLIAAVIDSRARLGVEHETPEPHGAGAYFTASWSDAEASRAALIPDATALGYDVYDPQEHLLIDTANTEPVTITHGSLGVYPALSRSMLTTLVARLVEPDPFMIISRDADVYAQTLIRDGHCDIEYRAGSADRHFAAVAPPEQVADLLWAWTTSGPTALDGLTWTRITF